MKRYDFALILFFLIIFLAPQLYSPLTSPNDYATIAVARTMQHTNDYMVPSLLSEILPYRPVAGYWATNLSLDLFGMNAFALHFFPALAVGLTALLLYLAVWQCTEDKSLSQLTAFFFMGSSLVMNYARLPINVPIGGFLILASLYCFFLAAREEKYNLQRFNLLLVSGLCAAASVLTVGIVSLFLIFFLAAGFLLAEKRFAELALLPPLFLLVAAAALTPYFLLLNSEDLPFLDLLKDASTLKFIHGDSDYRTVLLHTGLKLLLPCAIFLVLLFTKGAREGRLSHLPERNSLVVFSACLILGIPVFYSFSAGATVGDLYPVSAPASFLAALGMIDYLRGSNRRRTFNWLLNVCALLLISIPTGLLIGESVNSPYGFYETFAWQQSYLFTLFAAIAWGVFLLCSATATIGVRLVLFIAGMMICFLTTTYPQYRVNPVEAALPSYRLLYNSPNSVIYAVPELVNLTGCVLERPDVRYYRGPAAKINAGAADGRSFESCVRAADSENRVLLLAFDRPEELFAGEIRLHGQSNSASQMKLPAEELPEPNIFPCGPARLYVWPKLPEAPLSRP